MVHCNLIISSFCSLHAAATGRCLLQKRKPVDVWGFVKTPYGLMMIFGLFVVFVVPKLKVGSGDRIYACSGVDDSQPACKLGLLLRWGS